MVRRKRDTDDQPSVRRLVLQAAAIVAAISTLASGFWLFDGQYERKTEAVAHARDDVARSLWAQMGVTQLRQSILEDRVYDLAARKAALGRAFPSSDEVSLQRYTKQLDEQNARVGELRREIDETAKH